VHDGPPTIAAIESEVAATQLTNYEYFITRAVAALERVRRFGIKDTDRAGAQIEDPARYRRFSWMCHTTMETVIQLTATAEVLSERMAKNVVCRHPGCFYNADGFTIHRSLRGHTFAGNCKELICE
jgi:hypothetical protein